MTTQKIAIALIHGVGKRNPKFSKAMAAAIRARFTAGMGGAVPDPASELVIRRVYWAPVLQGPEDELWKRVQKGGPLEFMTLRQLMIDFAGDAIAYQPTPSDRRIYDDVHKTFAGTLKYLAIEAGADAPLCVIAHSLGTAIASNYVYDLQHPSNIAPAVKKMMTGTALEAGDTLALLYTMGSPIAIWSLRYPDFGAPIDFPAQKLATHWPTLKGEWVNLYDKDDVIGYPLRTLNAGYRKSVSQDQEVNVGTILTSWNPGSHVGYWTDKDVIDVIAGGLLRAWHAVNP